MEKMMKFIDERLMPLALSASAVFVAFALVTQVTFACLSAWGPEERMLSISNKMSLKFDGTFKNHSDNIFYEAK